MFKPHNATPKVDYMYGLEFNIKVEPLALRKMQYYVEHSKLEIGWLGTAWISGPNEITVGDTLLFEQEVHSTTCEITPAGLAKVATELIQTKPKEERNQILGNLRLWGHSHVNMSVSPSGQDDDQMYEFAANGGDWMLRVICNKKGDMKFDMYNYQQTLMIRDIKWEIALPDAGDLEEVVKAEMKEKVTEKVIAKTNWSTSSTPARNTGVVVPFNNVKTTKSKADGYDGIDEAYYADMYDHYNNPESREIRVLTIAEECDDWLEFIDAEVLYELRHAKNRKEVMAFIKALDIDQWISTATQYDELLELCQSEVGKELIEEALMAPYHQVKEDYTRSAEIKFAYNAMIDVRYPARVTKRKRQEDARKRKEEGLNNAKTT